MTWNSTGSSAPPPRFPAVSQAARDPSGLHRVLPGAALVALGQPAAVKPDQGGESLRAGREMDVELAARPFVAGTGIAGFVGDVRQSCDLARGGRFRAGCPEESNECEEREVLSHVEAMNAVRCGLLQVGFGCQTSGCKPAAWQSATLRYFSAATCGQRACD